MSTRARLTALFAVLGALVAVAVVLTIAVRPAATSAAAPGGASPYEVAAGLDDCGRGWGEMDPGSGGTTVPGGDMSFDIANGTVAGIEVYVQAIDSKKVYLDLESIGAGAHAKARVTLGAGRYRFVCLPADADPLDRICAAVGAHLQVELELSDFATAVNRNMGQLPDDVRGRLRAEGIEYTVLWRNLLDDARAAGVIRPDVDLRAARLLIMGALNWALEWWHPEHGPLTEVIKTAQSLVRHGLGVSRERAAPSP